MYNFSQLYHNSTSYLSDLSDKSLVLTCDVTNINDDVTVY